MLVILPFADANTEKLILKWPQNLTEIANSSTDKTLKLPYSQTEINFKISPIRGSCSPNICIPFQKPDPGKIFELRVNWPSIYPLGFLLFLAISSDNDHPLFCVNATFNGVVASGSNFSSQAKFIAG